LLSVFTFNLKKPWKKPCCAEQLNPCALLRSPVVKHSEKVTAQDFKGLRYLQNKAQDKFLKGIVLYTGSQILPFDENLWALPVAVLWGH
jgi:hypothetical protein